MGQCVYYGAQNLGLDAERWATLLAVLEAMGHQDHPIPMHNTHWRARGDGDAMLFHAEWNVEDWTLIDMKTKLGALFGVDAGTITHATISMSHSDGNSTRVVTFGRAGTDYLRLAAFGGVGATLPVSNAEARGYLKANAADWGGG